MKALLILLLVVSMLTAASETEPGLLERLAAMVEGSQEPAEEAEVEVIELFRSETTEELEAAFTDGYPPAWLEEVLSDTTIPEEDRYWLDCRMRAAIAQDLHLFHDEQDNPIRIEADWITHGEDYWRENFIVNPTTEDRTWDSPDMPSNMYGEPGMILNRFGDEVGTIALASTRIKLSRDASVGLMVSGGVQLLENPASHLPYACYFYMDGTFNEIEIPVLGMYQYDISMDGTLACFGCSSPARRPQDDQGLSYLSRAGENQFIELMLPCHYGMGPINPAVSPEGRYVAIPLREQGVGVYSDNFEKLVSLDEIITVHDLEYSPDGDFLCVSPHGYLLDSSTLEVIWDIPQEIPGASRYFRASSNGLCSVVWETTLRDMEDETENLQKIYWNQNLVHVSTGCPGEMGVSPNGIIVLQSSRSFLVFQEVRAEYAPFVFWMVREVR